MIQGCGYASQCCHALTSYCYVLVLHEAEFSLQVILCNDHDLCHHDENEIQCIGDCNVVGNFFGGDGDRISGYGSRVL